MTYFKIIKDGFVIGTGIASEPYETEIDVTEWKRIQLAFAKKPADNFLLTDKLEWILSDDATIEDYESALNELGVNADA